MSHPALPAPVRLLGPAGILPQAICVAFALLWPEQRILAGIAGGLYAASILSFLGGLWWIEALMRGDRRAAPYAALCSKCTNGPDGGQVALLWKASSRHRRAE
ncbi:MAG: hypothetical protein ACK4TC_11250 [Sphingomonas pseudosanguinis]|uniref:hypothetical protein n=1 Tax=Sphingomonas pseudosanguinis TaxID=413712 RepID=UPI00391C9985